MFTVHRDRQVDSTHSRVLANSYSYLTASPCFPFMRHILCQPDQVYFTRKSEIFFNSYIELHSFFSKPLAKESSSKATSGVQPVALFENKVLLEVSHTHSFTYRLRLLSCYDQRHTGCRGESIYIWPFTEKVCWLVLADQRCRSCLPPAVFSLLHELSWLGCNPFINVTNKDHMGPFSASVTSSCYPQRTPVTRCVVPWARISKHICFCCESQNNRNKLGLAIEGWVEFSRKME